MPSTSSLRPCLFEFDDSLDPTCGAAFNNQYNDKLRSHTLRAGRRLMHALFPIFVIRLVVEQLHITEYKPHFC